MSVDFQIFSPAEMSQEHLQQFASQHPGLRIESPSNKTTTVYVAADGTDQPVLQIGDSYECAAEDMPEAVASMEKLQYLTYVTVPAIAPDWAPAMAMDLCRVIAKYTNGAAYDPQADEIFYPNRIENVHKSEKEKNIDSLELVFLLPYDAVDNESAKHLLNALRCYPITLPIRAQDLQGNNRKIDSRTDTTFVDLWAEALKVEVGAALMCSSTPPCYHLSFFFCDRRSDFPFALTPVRAHCLQLTFDATEFQKNPESAGKLTDLFCELSKSLRPFYAAAYLQRGAMIKGRTIYLKPGSEPYTIHASKSWLGLPPDPPWLTWFGASYAKLLAPLLVDNPFVRRLLPETLFLLPSPMPLHKDELKKIYPPLPTELLFTELEFDSKNPFAPRFRPAEQIPS